MELSAGYNVVESGKKGDLLHVFSCYAAARKEDEKGFYDILQQDVSGVQSEECYVMLGDFNA